MWKYILIIAFLLFAIREINLMNESLYIAPDTHEVVVKDKTVIGKVVQVVEKLEKSKKFGIEVETNQTQQAETASKKPQKTSQKAPSLSAFEERNNSAKLQSAREKTALSKPTLQEFEREVMQTRSKLRTSSQKSGKKRVTHRQQRETTTQTSSHSKSVQHAEVYPNTYQSAQEKVNAILRQMRGAN